MEGVTMSTAGSIVSIWRFPIKSMLGEELNGCEITSHGILGDRASALIDLSDGKVASAKNPRKWSNLFDFRARYAMEPQSGHKLPTVRITLPDGTEIMSGDRAVNQVLSRALNREVRLETREPGQEEILETTFPGPWVPQLEEYWPDMEGLRRRDEVTDEMMPEGTFFDLGSLHLLTTATLNELQSRNPQARFETRRFRPNLVIQTPEAQSGFVENDWVGKTLRVGSAVRINIFKTCGRCVMTTLPQGDLPKDASVLRTAAQHNNVQVGVYASVIQGGTVRRGDLITLE
jgi:hypothetical protein